MATGIGPEELRRQRLALGMSQAELARALGLASNTIARWEQGKLAIGSPLLVQHAMGGLRATRVVGSGDVTAGPRRASPVLPGTSRLPRVPNILGRADELCYINTALGDGVRLLTLVGPGGVGKTCLAIAAAAACARLFDSAPAFIDLGPLQNPALLATSVARALGLQEIGPTTAIDLLKSFLDNRQMLLVVDNLEHLLPTGADVIGRLFEAIPSLSLLVTSREALRLRAERQLPIRPLVCPQTPSASAASILRFPSVQLFLERCRAIEPEFSIDESNAPAVAQLCTRLDGLPLAIELAAGRIRSLAPRDMLEQLEEMPELLQTSNADRPDRHRSLRAAVDWSYTLLPWAEQALFRRLSVFAGGATLDAIRSVCFNGDGEAARALHLVGQLVEKSLVTVAAAQNQGPIRYTLLQTVRLCAREKLQRAGEDEEFRRRHATFFLGVVRAAARELWRTNQVERLDELEAELANLRLLLDRATNVTATLEDLQVALQIAALPWPFWDMRGHHTEMRARLEGLLARPAASGGDVNRAAALDTLGWLAYGQGDFQTARRRTGEGFAIWQTLDEPHGLAWSAARRAMVLFNDRDLDRAEALLATTRQVGEDTLDPVLQAWAAYGDAHVRWARGELASAQTILSQTMSTDIREVIGPSAIAFALFSLALLALKSGDAAAAELRLQECLRLRRSARDLRTLPETLESLAAVAVTRSDCHRAAVLLGAARTVRELTGAGLLPWLKAGRDATFDRVRRELGDAVFERLCLEGSRKDLAQALEYALMSGEPAAAQDAPGIQILSRRERQVAGMLAFGSSNRDISTALMISERTAEAHVEHICTKLGVSSRGQAGVWAIQQGLVHISPPKLTAPLAVPPDLFSAESNASPRADVEIMCELRNARSELGG